MELKGFEQVRHIPGSTYRDVSTIIIVPSRGIEKHTETPACKGGDHRACFQPFFHQKITSAWQNMIAPMNAKRAFLYTTGHEVAAAYNEMVGSMLADNELKNWQYILTLEDDNLIPQDAHIRLLESIAWGNYDAVSGLYFTKGDYQMPMAYGNPNEFAKTGILDFRPRDTREAIESGTVMQVNGIAMGCALWKMSIFREIPAPWFVTCADVTPTGVKSFTQDLYFCERAVRAGKRFAVDCRVKVGHLDKETGVLY